jgi:hypothetical protein
MNPRLAAVACAVGLLAGCTHAPVHEVRVDAIAKPEAEKKLSFRVEPRNADTDETSLRYREAKAHVVTALSGRGMYEAPASGKADLIIVIEYGVGPPRIFERKVYQDKVETRSKEVPGPDGTTVFVSETVIAGREVILIPENHHEKYLRMVATENHTGAEGRAPQAWVIDASSDGPSADLRKYLPILAAASIEHIGRNTDGPVVIRLKDEPDGAIDFVRNGMPAERPKS